MLGVSSFHVVAQSIALSIVLALVRKMVTRASDDKLEPDHPVRVRSSELHRAYELRFLSRPPDMSNPGFIDAYIRAYAAWHAYSGED